jgi:hypothetical protein
VGGKKGGRDIFSEKVCISAFGFTFVVKEFSVMTTMSVLVMLMMILLLLDYF